MTLPGLVCLLIGLAFAEVLIGRLTGGRPQPRNRGAPPPPPPPPRAPRAPPGSRFTV